MQFQVDQTWVDYNHLLLKLFRRKRSSLLAITTWVWKVSHHRWNPTFSFVDVCNDCCPKAKLDHWTESKTKTESRDWLTQRFICGMTCWKLRCSGSKPSFGWCGWKGGWMWQWTAEMTWEGNFCLEFNFYSTFMISFDESPINLCSSFTGKKPNPIQMTNQQRKRNGQQIQLNNRKSTFWYRK